MDFLSNDIRIVLLFLCTTLLTKDESSLVAGDAEDSFYEPQNGEHIDAGGKRQGDVDDYVYCYGYAKYLAAPNTKMFNIILGVDCPDHVRYWMTTDIWRDLINYEFVKLTFC